VGEKVKVETEKVKVKTLILASQRGAHETGKWTNPAGLSTSPFHFSRFHLRFRALKVFTFPPFHFSRFHLFTFHFSPFSLFAFSLFTFHFSRFHFSPVHFSSFHFSPLHFSRFHLFTFHFSPVHLFIFSLCPFIMDDVAAHARGGTGEGCLFDHRTRTPTRSQGCQRITRGTKGTETSTQGNTSGSRKYGDAGRSQGPCTEQTNHPRFFGSAQEFRPRKKQCQIMREKNWDAFA
jgi:hypothetical protein